MKDYSVSPRPLVRVVIDELITADCFLHDAQKCLNRCALLLYIYYILLVFAKISYNNVSRIFFILALVALRETSSEARKFQV